MIKIKFDYEYCETQEEVKKRALAYQKKYYLDNKESILQREYFGTE